MSHFHENQVDGGFGDSLLGVLAGGAIAVCSLIDREDETYSHQAHGQKVANQTASKNLTATTKNCLPPSFVLKAKENEKKIQEIRAKIAGVSQKLSLPDGKQNAEFNLGNVSFRVDPQEEKVYVRVKR